MNIKKYYLLNAIIIMITLAGCQQNNIPTPLKVTRSALSASQTPELIYPQPPTRIPIATQMKRAEIFGNLLSDPSCVLPCYFGVTPGITKWEDVITLFDSSGAQYEKQDYFIFKGK